MIINPITITVSDIHLLAAINALAARLEHVTEGSVIHVRAENALLEIVDARSAYINAKATAKLTAAAHALSDEEEDAIHITLKQAGLLR